MKFCRWSFSATFNDTPSGCWYDSTTRHGARPPAEFCRKTETDNRSCDRLPVTYRRIGYRWCLFGPPPRTRGRMTLFHLDRGSRLFEFLPELVRFVLRDRFLHVLRCAVDQILRFLEAKTGRRADDLMTLIFCAPAAFSTTVNSVCASAAGAAAPAPGIIPAPIIIGAAAVTPNFSSSAFLSSDASGSVSFSIFQRFPELLT